MIFNTGDIISIATCLVSMGVIYGAISQQLKTLTKAVEKHNNVIERLYVAEEKGKSNTRRIDVLEKQARYEY